MKKILLVSIISMACLTGCGKSVPPCSAPATKDLVIQIIKPTKEFPATLKDIRTVSVDSTTGKYSCAATVIFKPNNNLIRANWRKACSEHDASYTPENEKKCLNRVENGSFDRKSMSKDYNYTSELTDDDKQYVEVFEK